MSTTANISTKLLTTLFTHNIFYQLRTSRTYLIRFLTTLLLSLNTLSALSSSQGFPYQLFLCSLLTHTIYLVCLFTEKSAWTLGSLALLSDTFGLLARLNNSETFLGASLITVSRVSLYSIKEYPMVLNCISGLIYSTFHFVLRSYITKSYELYTDTYNFPAVTVQDFIKEHLTTVLVVFVSSMGASIGKNKTQEAHSKLKQEFKKTSGKHEVDKNALIKLQNEMKQVMQSQDLLVTYMSHEFRNHLNIMLGNLDVLFGLARDQAQTEILKSCKICGDLLLSQINNLLDVAKINTSRLDISEFPTKMTTFLNEFWSTMKRCTIKKGLIGELAIDKTFPLWINIDSQRVQQILYNILDNAVKFTSKGSVKVMFCWADHTSDDLEDQSVVLEDESMVFENTSPKTKSVKWSNMSGTKSCRGKTLLKETLEYIDHAKQIVLNTHQVDHANLEQMLVPRENTQSFGYLKVFISDTGSGILEEDQKKIYNPFIQGDGTVTRSHAGSGLGLFIVKKLIEKMNGEIKLESETNKGSCFKVTLPLTTFSREGIISFRSSYHITSDLHIRDKRKASIVRSATVGRLPVSSPKKFLAEVHWSNEPKRVLIVDDIEFNRSLMHTYFRSMHFEADFACNGLEALQMYQDNPDRYFAVTLDIQMPVMDGVTACKSIRNYEKRVGKKRKVPIIIVTGNADDDEKRQILAQDEVMADYFFRKPFGLNDCRICVQNILSAQTAETEL